MGQEIAAAVPGAEFVVIEGAGHFAFSEQPVVAAAVVDDFLARAS